MLGRPRKPKGKMRNEEMGHERYHSLAKSEPQDHARFCMFSRTRGLTGLSAGPPLHEVARAVARAVRLRRGKSKWAIKLTFFLFQIVPISYY